MTAALYLVPPGTLDAVATGSPIVLDGDEGRHAATVRRTRVGERVDVADGAGRIARCTVEAVLPGRVDLRVLDLADAPVRGPRLVLVQALAKGGRDEAAVETATELGVDAVVPWQASRCVVVWSGERAERGRRRWEATVRAAAKQSRRATVPAVQAPITTTQLTQRLGADRVTALVLHEDAVEPLVGVALPAAGDDAEILVIVGPEGGVTGDELAALAAAGARAVRLGPAVLRSSSAGPAALAVLSARLGRWDTPAGADG